MMTTDLTLDGYRLIRFLGRGGFGEVWLCRSEAMGDYRALKWIPATRKTSATYHMNEAAATSRDVQRIAEMVRVRLANPQADPYGASATASQFTTMRFLPTNQWPNRS